MCGISLGSIFSDVSPQARKTKEKINKCNYIKLESFVPQQSKKEPAKWEKTFANDTSDKVLTSKMYKEIIQLNTKRKKKPKTSNPITKWAKDLNRNSSKNDTQTAS